MRIPESNPFPFLVFLAGSLLLVGGVFWIYRPGAAIAAGVLLLALAYLGRRPGTDGGE